MKILLVEDDQIDAMAFTRAVSVGAPQDRVDVVKGGEEALDFLRDEVENQLPELVFLDLNLPRMSGFELLKIMRDDQRFTKMVVFVYSSSNHETDVNEAYKHHVAGYLVKSEFHGDSQVLADLLRIYRSYVTLQCDVS
jgi:CheY-like chemotaxis protein